MIASQEDSGTTHPALEQSHRPTDACNNASVKPAFIETAESMCLVEPEEPQAMQMQKHQVQRHLGAAGEILSASERVNVTVEEPDSDDSALARLTTEQPEPAAWSNHNPSSTPPVEQVAMRRAPQKMAIHRQMIFDAILLLFLVATHGQMIMDAILLLLLVGLYLYLSTLSSTRTQGEEVLLHPPVPRSEHRQGKAQT